MRCDSCGMAIKKRPIREELDGEVHYFCCIGCFEEDLCRRDRVLRRGVRVPGRRAAATPRP